MLVKPDTMKLLSITPENCIFFLGGHDLEMAEIKKLLLAKGFQVEDKNLSWGARISDYTGLFSESKTNICIELIEDIPLLPNYLQIDHHNALLHKESSIEQIAALLHIPLTRHQQLIAANDKQHIVGMQKINATEAEIRKIRKMDRAAQGVTPKMEKIAKEELKDPTNLAVYGELAVFKTTLPRFSPIADELCLKYRDYLIFNDSPNEITFTYYGKGANTTITNLFKKEIEARKAYLGGAGDGFFGINKNSFTANQMMKMIDKIKERYVNQTL